MRHFQVTRPDTTTGARPSHPAYRGAGTQKINPRAEIVRLPSGSIAQIPRFEPIYLAEARLKEALLFALPLSIILWILIGLAVWALFF